MTMAAPPPDSSSPLAVKADLAKRLVAALIDGILAAIVSFIPFIGGIIGAAYILLRDGLEFEIMDGRSIGKKIMKLRPVREDGLPMDVETSVKRNLPLCIGYVGSILTVIPILGWILAVLLGLVGLIVGVIEIVLVVTDPEGLRMGDKFGATRVIEVVD
jgi:uncharacterized RDD family membrane protein YckC